VERIDIETMLESPTCEAPAARLMPASTRRSASLPVGRVGWRICRKARMRSSVPSLGPNSGSEVSFSLSISASMVASERMISSSLAIRDMSLTPVAKSPVGSSRLRSRGCTCTSADAW